MRNISGKAAFLAGAAALFAPLAGTVFAPAELAAQDVRDLDDARSDVRIFTDEVTTEPVRYTYTIPPMTALRVDVIPAEGSDLDPMLTITDVATGEVLAEDDDGGDGLASRARIFSESGQRVEISVSSFAFFSGEETAGAFELHLRPSAYRPPETRAVSFGSQTSGILADGDIHLFTIQGEEGQLLEVALNAQDESLDPMLELYEGTNVETDPLASNDDGGDGLNSRLRFVLPETGTYTIKAMPFEGSSGDYSLRIAEASFPVLQSPQQAIGLGERLSGTLGEGYEFGSIDPAEITYQLTAEAIAAIRAGSGEVTFNMTTPMFEDEEFGSNIDAYLELGLETPIGYASILSDDDGGEGLNSRIAVDLAPLAAEQGWLERLRLRASSIGGGGAFEIELVEGMQQVENAFEDEYGFEGGMPAPPMIRPVPAD